MVSPGLVGHQLHIESFSRDVTALVQPSPVFFQRDASSNTLRLIKWLLGLRQVCDKAKNKYLLATPVGDKVVHTRLAFIQGHVLYVASYNIWTKTMNYRNVKG